MTLRERILNAESGIRVGEIVLPAHLRQISPHTQKSFLDMRIEWMGNRSWGESFKIGAKTVRLGHRRGDHIATYPHLYGLTAIEAEELLKRSLEGTLLHELGHALLDASPRLFEQRRLLEVAQAEGSFSTYHGHDPEGMGLRDVLHEVFAEAFRYWCMDDSILRAEFPRWHRLLDSASPGL